MFNYGVAIIVVYMDTVTNTCNQVLYASNMKGIQAS